MINYKQLSTHKNFKFLWQLVNYFNLYKYKLYNSSLYLTSIF